MSKAADLKTHLPEAADIIGTCRRETGCVLVETRFIERKTQKGSMSLFRIGTSSIVHDNNKENQVAGAHLLL